MELCELQERIAKWNSQALPERTLLQAAKKLLEEASECHVAAKETDAGRNDCMMVLREAADVAILCFVLANQMEAQLEDAINEKLSILFSRVHEQRLRDQARAGI